MSENKPECRGTVEQLLAWAKGSLASIAPNLKPDKDFRPVLLMALPGGLPSVVDVSECFRDDDSKRLLGTYLRLLFADARPTAAALVTMAWTVETDHAGLGEALKVRPSQSPRRKEVVQVTAYDGAAHVMELCEVTRRPGKHPQLGKWRRTEGGPVGGKFADALSGAFDAVMGQDPVAQLRREAGHAN